MKREIQYDILKILSNKSQETKQELGHQKFSYKTLKQKIPSSLNME